MIFDAYCFSEKVGGSPYFGLKWLKYAILTGIEVPITFLSLIGWRRLIYEKDSKFRELFENQHRGTQKTTRTQNIDNVGFTWKSGQKAISHIRGFLVHMKC